MVKESETLIQTNKRMRAKFAKHTKNKVPPVKKP